LLIALLLGARAGTVYVPNFSFETPSVPDEPPYAAPFLDYWQETSQPTYYNPTNFDNAPWQDLVGAFYNDPNDGAYIDNADGVQCGFLQALPEVGIFQDYNSYSDTQTGPTHAFNATFKPGHPYYLTAALIGGGGNMPVGATLQMLLYYRDSSNNMVAVASRTVTNTAALFPNNTNFVDFQLDVPTVQSNDPWAGQNIGIEFLCTSDFSYLGGYWDVDNVRLLEALNVPNFSFETPSVPDVSPYADPYLDYWQETPQPAYYDPSEFDNTPWQYLVGEFYNDPKDGAYIDNTDGVQCGFLQSLPGVGIFQDFNSFSDTQIGPTHAFDATYNVGKGYNLTVNLIGGGGDMPIGATLQLSLYYRDSSSNMVTVAAETITNSLSLFPVNTHFVSFELQVPAVKTTDPWAGQTIGIEALCTVDFSDYGGYWDIDNVILSETVAPALNVTRLTNGEFSFTLQSEPGLAFDILSATNLSGTNWSTVETVTNVTGTTLITAPLTNAPQKFYQAQQL
jgi:hypothetical protein